MDENRISGKAQNISGKIEEGIGRATGNSTTQAEGLLRRAGGTAQEMYGQARDAASDMAATAREGTSNLEDVLRNFIETQPYTTAAIALGAGWLLGRMHRPL